MALASFGARTPFITSTPSNAVTFASPAVGARFGLAAAGAASALVAFAVFSFAEFASLLPAMTGTAVMASMSVLENHFLGVNIDGLSSFRPAQAWATNMGRTLCHLLERCQGICLLTRDSSHNSALAQDMERNSVAAGNDAAMQGTYQNDNRRWGDCSSGFPVT